MEPDELDVAAFRVRVHLPYLTATGEDNDEVAELTGGDDFVHGSVRRECALDFGVCGCVGILRLARRHVASHLGVHDFIVAHPAR